MRLLLIVVMFLGLGCSPPDYQAIAEEVMRRQIASDIQLTIDKTTLRPARREGQLVHVCGEAVLHRPGTGPLGLNNARQRFITTFNRSSRAGGTFFDGRKDLEGKAAFQAQWESKCA